MDPESQIRGRDRGLDSDHRDHEELLPLLRAEVLLGPGSDPKAPCTAMVLEGAGGLAIT